MTENSFARQECGVLCTSGMKVSSGLSNIEWNLLVKYKVRLHMLPQPSTGITGTGNTYIYSL